MASELLVAAAVDAAAGRIDAVRTQRNRGSEEEEGQRENEEMGTPAQRLGAYCA